MMLTPEQYKKMKEVVALLQTAKEAVDRVSRIEDEAHLPTPLVTYCTSSKVWLDVNALQKHYVKLLEKQHTAKTL